MMGMQYDISSTISKIVGVVVAFLDTVKPWSNNLHDCWDMWALHYPISMVRSPLIGATTLPSTS